MNVDDFPTPDADVETVAPATVTHRIDAVERGLGSNNCAASQESLAGD